MQSNPVNFSTLARLGGLSRSAAKANAARRNGRLGGRPRLRRTKPDKKERVKI